MSPVTESPPQVKKTDFTLVRLAMLLPGAKVKATVVGEDPTDAREPEKLAAVEASDFRKSTKKEMLGAAKDENENANSGAVLQLNVEPKSPYKTVPRTMGVLMVSEVAVCVAVTLVKPESMVKLLVPKLAKSTAPRVGACSKYEVARRARRVIFKGHVFMGLVGEMDDDELQVVGNYLVKLRITGGRSAFTDLHRSAERNNHSVADGKTGPVFDPVRAIKQIGFRNSTSRGLQNDSIGHACIRS